MRQPILLVRTFALIQRMVFAPTSPRQKGAIPQHSTAGTAGANFRTRASTFLCACQARHHRREHVDVLKWHVQIGDAILFAPALQRFYQLLDCADEKIGVG